MTKMHGLNIPLTAERMRPAWASTSVHSNFTVDQQTSGIDSEQETPSQTRSTETATRQTPKVQNSASTESNDFEQTKISMDQVLNDYFRYPESLIDFSIPEGLTGKRGYFRFGQDVVCYGRLGSANILRERVDLLEDVVGDVHYLQSQVNLPFDPNEVVRNFLFERYAKDRAQSERSSSLHKFVREMYYLVRPALPVAIRAPLQRIRLRNWDKAKFPSWPVDRTVNILMRRLLALGMKARGITQLPFIWFWPDGAQGCATMTHDVETTAGRDFCGKLMDINDSFGIKSAFTVVPESRYAVSPEFLQSFRDRGFELNVHDLNHDGRLFDDRDEFNRRAQRINEYGRQFQSSGFRAGVLYRNQDWFDALEFSYDMSVPNVAHLDPQGGGCCTVMPFFIGNILELPLTTTQDYTIFNILGNFSTEHWENQMRLILEENGMISFIVHPDYIIRQRSRDVYKALLAILSKLRTEDDVWLALPGEVNKWWRMRSKMKLLWDGDSWRVTGDGKERAQIAFAVLDSDGDSVHFEQKPNLRSHACEK